MSAQSLSSGDAGALRAKRFLVMGATRHKGSKMAVKLTKRGYEVTARVRQHGARILDPYTDNTRHVVGNLSDEESSTREAVQGIDVVISTANGIVPQKSGDNPTNVKENAERLISLCEKAGVQRFVQSSVSTYPEEHRVPELPGKGLNDASLNPPCNLSSCAMPTVWMSLQFLQ